MSVDFQNGFVLGLTVGGKYIYQAKTELIPAPTETYTINLSIILNDVEVYNGDGVMTNSLQQALDVISKDWLMKKLKGWSSPLTYRNINGTNYETQEAFTNLILTDNSSAIGNRINGNLISNIFFADGVQPSEINLNQSSIAWSFIISEALTFRSVYINHAGYTTPVAGSTELLHHIEPMVIMTNSAFMGEFSGYGDWMYYIDSTNPSLLKRYNISTGVTETLSSSAPSIYSAVVTHFDGTSFYYYDGYGDTYKYTVSTDTWTTYVGVSGWVAITDLYAYYAVFSTTWLIARITLSDATVTSWDTLLDNVDLYDLNGYKLWVSGSTINLHNHEKHYAGTFGGTMTFQNFRGAIGNLTSLWDNTPMYFESDATNTTV
jgi:hypothetical protein